MKMTNLQHVEKQIGYSFKNGELLLQAFTRRSFAEENKNTPHNEILEFYGDKALDLVVMKKLNEYFGTQEENGAYRSVLDEGKLTEIKSRLVCIGTLFTGSNSNDFLYVGDKYLSVANLSGSGCTNNDINYIIQILFIDNQFNPCLWD